MCVCVCSGREGQLETTIIGKHQSGAMVYIIYDTLIEESIKRRVFKVCRVETDNTTVL